MDNEETLKTNETTAKSSNGSMDNSESNSQKNNENDDDNNSSNNYKNNKNNKNENKRKKNKSIWDCIIEKYKYNDSINVSKNVGVTEGLNDGSAFPLIGLQRSVHAAKVAGGSR